MYVKSQSEVHYFLWPRGTLENILKVKIKQNQKLGGNVRS